MATKKTTTRSAAKPATSRSGAGRTSSTSSTSATPAASSAPQGETKAAAEHEARRGKTVTSVSDGPLAVPVAEASGAGADYAVERQKALKVEGGLVNAGSGLTNQDAGLDAGQGVEDFLDTAAIGTTISKTGAGIQVVSPVGGGANRVFAGATLAEALEEMEAFFSGSPKLLTTPGPQDEGEDAEDEGEE